MGLVLLAKVAVIVCKVLMEAGARYNPLVMVPTEGASDHVPATLGVPPIVALNWIDWPPARETEEGANVTPMTGTSVITAPDVLVGSAKLAAVTTTFCPALMLAGA